MRILTDEDLKKIRMLKLKAALKHVTKDKDDEEAEEAEELDESEDILSDNDDEEEGEDD